MINYVERNGQEKSAYICDYEWDIEDAVSICQYLGQQFKLNISIKFTILSIFQV